MDTWFTESNFLFFSIKAFSFPCPVKLACGSPWLETQIAIFLIPNKPVSSKETSGSLFVTGQQMEVFFFYFKFAHSCLTVLSMKFSRQEYWSGLSFSSPGDLPNPGTEPRSPTLQADSSLSEPPGKPQQMELYSDMNKKEILPFATPWMDCKGIMPSETGQRQTLHDIVHR